MASKMKYPTGIQDFAEVINGGYTYVDKTRYIRLLEDMGKYYFLSRPRRFGKSLFLSTLEKYFEARRDLFNGLDIAADDNIDWTPRPVIKIALNTLDAKSENALINYLGSVFREYECKYDIPDYGDDVARRFEIIIKRACQLSGRKVVVLVDEYDAPLLNTFDNDNFNESYRDTLRAVFSVLKNSDEYIHFAFITGVSRFSQTSLFSGANHLKDISLEKNMAAICGITEKELRDLLMPGVREFAESLGISDNETLTLLKENYDGYHFSETSPDIYNPFSLLNALQSQKISNYWFASGTPGYLLKILKRDNFFLPDLDCTESLESDLSAKESYMKSPIALLYETGYITIKRYDEDLESYILGLPNKEVATSFSEALLPIYSDLDSMDCRNSFIKMRRAVLKGQPDLFMTYLKTFLQGNPYSNTELAKRETYFKNNIYLVFKALGFSPRNEEETCNSRMDLMLRTRRFIYIFELKTDGSAVAAMQQIDEKGYSLPYLDEGKKIIKIAANYSSKSNNIDSWQINEVDEFEKS